jgi:hypothetical protein
MPGTGLGWSLFGIPKLTFRARYVDDEESDEERGNRLCLFSPYFRFNFVSVAALH